MPHYYKSLLFLSNLISNGLQPDVVKKLSTKKIRQQTDHLLKI